MAKQIPKPPKLAESFLRWFCAEEVQETLLGDLYELYEKRVLESAKWKADLYFFLEVIDVCRPFAWKNRSRFLTNYRDMFYHYCKIAWRRFLRQKAFTFINIFGLTLGFSSFLLILFFVNHEHSFDDFHENKDDVYRVNFTFQDNAGNSTTLANSPPALAPGIHGKFAELKKISRLRYAMNCLFSNGDSHHYEEQGYYADSLFLEILQFELLSGDRQSALSQPNSIVITKDLALKYFNEPNPVGKSLQFNNTVALKVTGVLADIPQHSHLDFNFLLSFSTYTIPEGYASDLTSWSWLGFLTYVELKPHTDPQYFESGLAQFFKELNPDDPSPMQPIVQGLSDIYLGSGHMTDDTASPIRSGNRFSVRALMLVAILILIIAGFNFSNLSHALSIKQRKLTGVRKVLGADGKSVFSQQMTETLLLTFLCLILSFGLVYFMFPTVAQFMHWEFELHLSQILRVIPLSIFIGLIVGLVAGLYPAQHLANINIIQSLKDLMSTGHKQPIQLKHILLTLQFAISLGLICATNIMVNQINYLNNVDTGYSAENVVLIKMLPSELSRSFELYKEQLTQHSSVKSVSRSERVVGEPWPFSVIRKVGEDPEMSKRIFFNQSDYDYFSTLDVTLKAGRTFSKDHLNDPTKSAIINQKAATLLGLENPIGQQVHFFELDGPRTIIGVVDDFNYTSLHQEIGPAVMILPFIDLEYMFVRFNAGNPKDQIAVLESTWQQVSGNSPLDWKFLNMNVHRLYQSEQKLASMIQGFSILAILLACLGMYGLVTFMINNRLKEVGVRKVLGASVISLYTMFVKTYLYQTLLALVLILPFAHYFLNNWLENFAYHIEISWWVYPISAIVLILIILLTITFQILRATWVNPGHLLRNE